MAGKPIKVLLIEDNPGDARLFQEMLKEARRDTFVVECAEDLALGLQRLAQEGPDVVLLDLGLPDSQGLDTFVKAHAAVPMMAIVVLTALNDEDIALLALKAGAQDYLVKGQTDANALARAIRYAIERTQAEAALRESEARFRELFDEAPVGYHELDTEGRIVRVNRTELAMLGYAAEEMLGHFVWEFIIEAEESQQNIAGTLAGTIPADQDVERTFRRKDGSLLPVLISRNLLRDASGRSTGLRSTLQDITARKRAEKALAESEQKYRQLFTDSKEPMALTVEGIIRDVNPAWLRLMGYDDPSQVMGKDIIHFVCPEDHKVLLGWRASPSRDLTRLERIRNRHKDGTPIDVEVYSSEMFIKGERAILTTVRDVTARKRAEEALVKAKTEWERTFEAVPDLITILDKDFNIVRVNKAMADGLKVPPDQAVGLKCYSAVHGAKAPPPFCPHAQLLADGKEHIVEVKEERLGGEFLVSVSPLRDGEGKVTGSVHVARNITARKRAEEALTESVEKYRTLFEDSLEAMSLTQGGKIVDVNAAWLRMHGFSDKSEVLGKDVLNVVHPDDQIILTTRRSMPLQERPRVFHLRDVRKNGSELHVEGYSSAITVGGELAILTTVRDITERKRAQEQIERQVQRLQALRTIDMAISASLDLRVTLSVFLDQLTTVLGLHAAAVLLLNPHTQTLEYAAGRGFRSGAVTRTSVRMGEDHPGRAALERRTTSIPDLNEDRTRSSRVQLLAGEDFVSYHAVPLIAKGQIKGVLETFHRIPLEKDPEWQEALEALAGQGAIAIDNAALFDDLQRSNVELALAYDTTLEGWSRALDMRDKETEGHTQRVTEITMRLAREMGIGDAELVHIRRGALLHDIGKMAIPDGILLKPGTLNKEERAIIRNHPKYAYELLSPIAFLRPALDIPYCHHENCDGTGYPRHLKGDQIPLAARIFAVVDSWDSLRSNRPYRPAWPDEKARQYISRQAGRHFDPDVVKPFLKLLDTSG